MRSVAAAPLLLLALAALAVTFVPGALGYERYVLVGGSMEPTIHRGSLVFDDIVRVRELRAGDVITYVPPGRERPITHRIVSVRRGQAGGPVFRTQGDASAQPDRRAFQLDAPTQARYRFAIPYVGWVFVVLSSRPAKLVLLALPLLLLVAVALTRARPAGRLATESGAA
jgi:signal peptidase I